MHCSVDIFCMRVQDERKQTINKLLLDEDALYEGPFSVFENKNKQ
jgi:hypothetical protein